VITTSKWLAIVAVAFVAGSFIASPELRAFAANTVRSIDIVDGEVKTADLGNNAVTAAKVKDAEIKAAEIATDAVGAAELQGVSKLLFGKCDTDEAAVLIGAGSLATVTCNIAGVDNNDAVLVTFYGDNDKCFEVAKALAQTNKVVVSLRNDCTTPTQFSGMNNIGVVVFDK
jgi:hypothetical protein